MSLARRAPFETTQWSLIVAAGGEASAPARDALSTLCERYWYPLYAYVRRAGYDADAAQDLTQAFFLRVLDKQDWREVRRERGRFRSFLLASMKHFLANERRSRARVKRGGRAVAVPLDFLAAEGRYRHEPATLATPETVFERRWALTVLERVLSRLRQDAEARGEAALFDHLKQALTGALPHGSYAGLGEAIGRSEGAVKTAVYRLRRRFQRTLRQEIGATVSLPADVEDEIQYLFNAVSGHDA